MSEIVVKLEGVEEFQRKLKQLDEETKREVDKSIYLTAKMIARRAQELAPVKTGHLKRNIVARKIQRFTSEVTVGVKYAVFVEFGTRHWKGKRFFRPAIHFATPYGEAMLARALETAKLKVGR